MLPKNQELIEEYKNKLSEKAKKRVGKMNGNYGKLKQDIDYNTLNDLYINQNKSMKEIGNIYFISPATILSYLKKLNINTRRKGYVCSEKIRKNLSESHIGIKQSFEWRKNKSIALKKAYSEGRHPNYKHGLSRDMIYLKKIIRNSFEYKEWRKKVFERDNYICRECNIKCDYIEAHHIKPFWKFPDLIYDLDNGLTLCKKCHNKIKGGNFVAD
jgi:hypothetical protein